MNNISENINTAYVLLQQISVTGRNNIRNLDTVLQILEQVHPAVMDMENELAKKEVKDDV